MKRAYVSRKYDRLIEWIALNDNTGDDEPIDVLAGSLTVTMIAHCYDVDNKRVAADVYAIRHPE